MVPHDQGLRSKAVASENLGRERKARFSAFTVTIPCLSRRSPVGAGSRAIIADVATRVSCPYRVRVVSIFCMIFCSAMSNLYCVSNKHCRPTASILATSRGSVSDRLCSNSFRAFSLSTWFQGSPFSLHLRARRGGGRSGAVSWCLLLFVSRENSCGGVGLAHQPVEPAGHAEDISVQRECFVALGEFVEHSI